MPLNTDWCDTLFVHCSQTLESLCTNLYDALRPLIIHINHLETLAELCSILKVCLCIISSSMQAMISCCFSVTVQATFVLNFYSYCGQQCPVTHIKLTFLSVKHNLHFVVTVRWCSFCLLSYWSYSYLYLIMYSYENMID